MFAHLVLLSYALSFYFKTDTWKYFIFDWAGWALGKNILWNAIQDTLWYQIISVSMLTTTDIVYYCKKNKKNPTFLHNIFYLGKFCNHLNAEMHFRVDVLTIAIKSCHFNSEQRLCWSVRALLIFVFFYLPVNLQLCTLDMHCYCKKRKN